MYYIARSYLQNKPTMNKVLDWIIFSSSQAGADGLSLSLAVTAVTFLVFQAKCFLWRDVIKWSPWKPEVSWVIEKMKSWKCREACCLSSNFWAWVVQITPEVLIAVPGKCAHLKTLHFPYREKLPTPMHRMPKWLKNSWSAKAWARGDCKSWWVAWGKGAGLLAWISCFEWFAKALGSY